MGSCLSIINLHSLNELGPLYPRLISVRGKIKQICQKRGSLVLEEEEEEAPALWFILQF